MSRPEPRPMRAQEHDAARTGGSSGARRRLGRYEVLSLLGAGGMGEVYRARDPQLDRDVALKVLRSRPAGNPEPERRFRQEARAAGALSHPNILAIYDVEAEEGVLYIVSELVEGHSLRKELEGAGTLPTRKLLDIAVQFADGLSAAHHAGIVHRDLKPENLMLTPEGRVKILDFGLAAVTPSEGLLLSASPITTSPGTILGTAAYMSPEQARGVPADYRSDQFSFGAILYEMAAGRAPFRGETAVQTLSAIVGEEPERVTRLNRHAPAPLQRIIERCLAKEPQGRYESTADLHRELAGLREDTPERRTSAAWRHPRLAVAIAGCLLLVGTLGYHQRRPKHNVGPSRSLSRLTFDPGLQTEPSWSPDGRFVAYSSDRSGNFDIWVQPASGGDAVQVTKDPAHDWQPDWSPTGSQLAFRSERQGGGLFLASALGGDERKLAGFGYRPRWSPDSRLILFAGTSLEDLDESPSMYVVSPDGQAPRPILESFLGQFRSRPAAAWHPDGCRISFWGYRRQDGGATFWTVPLEGGVPVRSDPAPEVRKALDEVALENRRGHFAWAPSGRALIFVGLSREVRNIWKVGVDPQTLQWTAGPERLTAGPGAESDVTLSPDGKRIAFVTATRNSRIWTFPLNVMTGTITGEGRPVTPEEWNSFSPDLTRDGRDLLYVTEQPGRAHRHHLTAQLLPSGPGRRLLVSDIEHGEDRLVPRWSPDGSRIAYQHRAIGPGPLGPCAIRLIEIATREEREVTSPRPECSEVASHWTADGRWLVTTGKRYVRDRVAIALLPLSAAPRAETEARIVTSDARHDLRQATLSPDERWIAFTATPSADARVSTIFVVSRSGGSWLRVTDGASLDDKPRWSSDGRTIYFVSARGGVLNVWGTHFDPARKTPAGDVFRVTAFEGPRRMILPSGGSMDLAITGGALVLPIRDVTGGIWMLEGVDR
jgi:eukaryotic-like serine/threonine-protein kinase